MITYDNIAAMRLNRYAFNLETQLNKLTEQVKTQSTINSFSDDPASSYFLSKTNASKEIYNVTQENVQSGLTMIDIGNTALNTMKSYAKEMKALVEEAQTASISRKKTIQTELNDLATKMYKLRQETGFNGLQIFEKAEAPKIEEEEAPEETKNNSNFVEDIEHLTTEELEMYGYVVINSVDDLKKINDDLNGMYALGADIDLSGVDWTPIGSDTNRFKGEFFGNGYTIKNLNIDSSDTGSTGFFASIQSAYISDVGFENATVNGKNSVGIIAGHAVASTIYNVYASGNVHGENQVGGLVGHLYSSDIESSYAEMSSVTGVSSVGGLVGFAHYNSSITKSYSNSTVTGISSSSQYIGGLIGSANTITIDNSFASGAVSGYTSVGGFVGENTASTITNSYANASVSGSDTSKTGGFIGTLKGNDTSNKIENSVYDINASGIARSVGNLSNGASVSQYSSLYGKNSQEMTTEQTYLNLGWDNTTWIFTDGQYPQLRVLPEEKPAEEPEYFGSLKAVEAPIRIQTGRDSSNASHIEIDTTFEFEEGLYVDISSANNISKALSTINSTISDIEDKQASFTLDKMKLNSQLASRTNYSTQYSDTLNAWTHISSADASEKVAELSSQLQNAKALRSSSINLNADITKTLIFGAIAGKSSFDATSLLLNS